MIKNQNFKRNSHVDDLINDAVNNNEGVIGLNGALMVDTGEFSGRIPNDKFIVDEDSSTEKIWWGEVNQKLSEENFDYLLNKVLDTYEGLHSSYYVFVVYGIVAPEYNWNDYEGIDVKGKTVVMLINDPGFDTRRLNLFNGRAMTYYGRWTYKFEEAAKQGAAAAIIIHEEEAAAYPWSVVENSWTGPQLDLQRKDLGMSRTILESWISLDIANEIFTYTGFNYDSLKEFALDKSFQAFEMKGLSLTSKINSDISYFSSHNLIGYKEGTSKPDEYLIFMAHWDHLGINDELIGDQIFNGAADNAAGVAAVIELARKFDQVQTERSIIFTALTLEESGLLGSAYLAENPPVDLANIVAGFNFDRVLPTGKTKDMAVIGYGASELEDYLEKELEKQGRYINPDPNPEKGYFYRSDHISFAKKGVPVLYSDDGFDLEDGGIEKGFNEIYDYTNFRYHGVKDEYDPSWNLEGFEQTINTIFNISLDLSNSSDWPNWYEGNEFRATRDAQLSSKNTP